MRKVVTLSLCVVMSLLTLRAQAGNYIIYKATYKVNRFVQDPATKEWLFNKKIDQLSFTGYYIFKRDYTVENNNYPARIISFRPKKVKYSPAQYDAATGKWVAIPDAKTTNKLLIYPCSVKWPDGKTTSLLQNYCDTAADDFYIFGGIWDTIDIKRSTFRNHIMAFMDFYGDDAVAVRDEERGIEIDNSAYRTVKGYSESYSGWVKNNELAPSLGGNISIDLGDVVYKSKLVKFRLNNAMTQKALTGDEKTMIEAVDNVVGYLVRKGHASTWVE